jgi:hypothetical protein
MLAVIFFSYGRPDRKHREWREKIVIKRGLDID